MYPGGFIAEVTNLSPEATEKDLYDFFSHCGAVEHIEIVRSGEYASSAYVTFRDCYALETAVLLSGAQIVDQQVCIAYWGTTYVFHTEKFASTPGEAVTIAQQVVKTMVAKGYVLGKDALFKAKAFDESHQMSSSAAAKFAELSKRIGLTDTIQSSMDTVRSVDGKYGVSDFTKSAVLVTGTAAVAAAKVTGKTAAAAANVVVNSSYFGKGALWVSDVLHRAAKAAADMGSHATK
ncbi:binding partner of ACD11 1 [Rutidosis leptorrhynchoides]|uniref:binding partner of ACD11 1 n=1 Tax=Rutidosis leptorrhynchoides TaxID=125765 RepID=UPI003A99D14F